MPRALIALSLLLWSMAGIWLDSQIRAAPADASLISLILREAIVFPSWISLHLIALSATMALIAVTVQIVRRYLLVVFGIISVSASLVKTITVANAVHEIGMPIYRLDVLSISMGALYAHWTISILIGLLVMMLWSRRKSSLKRSLESGAVSD